MKDKITNILIDLKSGKLSIVDAQNEIEKLYNNKCNLTPEAKNKFDYISGRT